MKQLFEVEYDPTSLTSQSGMELADHCDGSQLFHWRGLCCCRRLSVCLSVR